VRVNKAVLLIATLFLLAGCQTAPTPTATATPQPKATAIPPTPTLKVWPTSSTPAPEEPVIPVGYTTAFQDAQHKVSGNAVMGGLQTIVIVSFTYDGQCPDADIRLVKEGNLGNAVAVLGKLEQRPYDHETLVFIVPRDLKPGDADSIAVYCSAPAGSLGWGRFR